MKSKEEFIPEYVRSCLWSYNIEQLDREDDRERIITNVLNYGTAEAVHWLFSVYSREEIKEVVSRPLPGEWGKKSINFWSLMLEVPLAYPKNRFT